MSALLSFLGGSAFRAVWGEFSAWMNKRQEHKYEIQRMELQGKLDGDTHARNMEANRLQAELGIKTIEVKSDADQAVLAAEAFREAMKQAAVPTGIKWVDAWNASVRPAFASVSLFI
jgi:S-formylglutathione hydrolase FrmB